MSLILVSRHWKFRSLFSLWPGKLSDGRVADVTLVDVAIAHHARISGRGEVLLELRAELAADFLEFGFGRKVVQASRILLNVEQFLRGPLINSEMKKAADLWVCAVLDQERKRGRSINIVVGAVVGAERSIFLVCLRIAGGPALGLEISNVEILWRPKRSLGVGPVFVAGRGGAGFPLWRELRY